MIRVVIVLLFLLSFSSFAAESKRPRICPLTLREGISKEELLKGIEEVVFSKADSLNSRIDALLMLDEFSPKEIIPFLLQVLKKIQTNVIEEVEAKEEAALPVKESLLIQTAEQVLVFLRMMGSDTPRELKVRILKDYLSMHWEIEKDTLSRFPILADFSEKLLYEILLSDDVSSYNALHYFLDEMRDRSEEERLKYAMRLGSAIRPITYAEDNRSENLDKLAKRLAQENINSLDQYLYLETFEIEKLGTLLSVMYDFGNAHLKDPQGLEVATHPALLMFKLVVEELKSEISKKQVQVSTLRAILMSLVALNETKRWDEVNLKELVDLVDKLARITAYENFEKALDPPVTDIAKQLHIRIVSTAMMFLGEHASGGSTGKILARDFLARQNSKIQNRK